MTLSTLTSVAFLLNGHYTLQLNSEFPESFYEPLITMQKLKLLFDYNHCKYTLFYKKVVYKTVVLEWPKP